MIVVGKYHDILVYSLDKWNVLRGIYRWKIIPLFGIYLENTIDKLPPRN